MRALFVIVLAALALSGCSKSNEQQRLVATAAKTPSTLTSFDQTRADEQPAAAHSIVFKNAPLDDVLDLYAKTSHRSIIRSGNLPDAKFTFSNEQSMTRVQVLQALDTLLAANGIATVPQGNDYIKIVPEKEAPRESPPIFTGSPDQLPDSNSFVIYALEVKGGQAVMQAITPFARMPNSIIYIPGDHATQAAKSMPLVSEVQKALGPKTGSILILRDYSCNVRKMLQVVTKMQAGNR